MRIAGHRGLARPLQRKWSVSLLSHGGIANPLLLGAQIAADESELSVMRMVYAHCAQTFQIMQVGKVADKRIETCYSDAY